MKDILIILYNVLLFTQFFDHELPYLLESKKLTLHANI